MQFESIGEIARRGGNIDGLAWPCMHRLYHARCRPDTCPECGLPGQKIRAVREERLGEFRAAERYLHDQAEQNGERCYCSPCRQARLPQGWFRNT
jgi:hypothetical protein